MSVVKLNINNREFQVECSVGQEERLTHLSYELDRRIKENAKAFGDTNTMMLFLLTSLQLLDEVDDIKASAGQGFNLNDEIGRATITTLSQISGKVEEIAAKISRKVG